MVKQMWGYVYSFRQNTRTWQTDGRTDTTRRHKQRLWIVSRGRKPACCQPHHVYVLSLYRDTIVRGRFCYEVEHNVGLNGHRFTVSKIQINNSFRYFGCYSSVFRNKVSKCYTNFVSFCWDCSYLTAQHIPRQFCSGFFSCFYDYVNLITTCVEKKRSYRVTCDVTRSSVWRHADVIGDYSATVFDIWTVVFVGCDRPAVTNSVSQLMEPGCVAVRQPLSGRCYRGDRRQGAGRRRLTGRTTGTQHTAHPRRGRRLLPMQLIQVTWVDYCQ